MGLLDQPLKLGKKLHLFNDGVSWKPKKIRLSKRALLRKEFLKEKVEHPRLSNRVIWRIVYDHHKKR